MDPELEKLLEQINKRLDEQFRFTRFVVLLCGMTIIGVLVFTVLMTFQSLPAQIIAHYMSNLEPIVYEWKSYEEIARSQRRLPGALNDKPDEKTSAGTTTKNSEEAAANGDASSDSSATKAAE